MSLLQFWKFAARRRCHGSILCCQYVDLPLCNGGLEPHWLAKLIWRLRVRER
jgi:hypothetical protein